MSADNGVYIGKFPTVNGGVEYRVIHGQAIENCDDNEQFPTELTDYYRVCYYRGSGKVFSTESEALLYAHQYAKTFPVLEYGVCMIEYNRPLLDMTAADANEAIDAWFASGLSVP